MNPLTEKALTINCSQPKLDKFEEVITCDFSQQQRQLTFTLIMVQAVQSKSNEISVL